MKKYPYLIILAIALSLHSGCSLDPEKRLNAAIDEYFEKKPGALTDLQHEFLNYITIQSIEARELSSNGNILYTLDGNDAEIAYPEKIKLSLADGEGIKNLYMNEQYCVITDGLQFSIFDSSGSHKNDETVGDKKKQVKAILLSDDNILYYRDYKLFNYNIIINTSEALLKESFPPPFTQYYNVMLQKIDSRLGILAGIAGSYNFSLVNLTDNSVMLKNLGVSSSKIHLGKQNIYYITGNAGNWELMQYNIPHKKKKSMAKLPEIEDVELVSSGYILQNKDRLFGSRYEMERFAIPFTYQLSGTYRGRVVLRHKDTYNIIDINKLFTGIEILRSKIPDLFINKSTAQQVTGKQQKPGKK